MVSGLPPFAVYLDWEMNMRSITVHIFQGLEIYSYKFKHSLLYITTADKRKEQTSWEMFYSNKMGGWNKEITWITEATLKLSENE